MLSMTLKLDDSYSAPLGCMACVDIYMHNVLCPLAKKPGRQARFARRLYGYASEEGAGVRREDEQTRKRYLCGLAVISVYSMDI